MAEDEQNELEEDEEEEEVVVEQEVQEKKIPVKIILITIIFTFLLGGGFFIWKGGLLANFIGSGETDALDEKDQKQNADPLIGPIFSMDTFIVNLVGGQGKSYLKVKMDLELENELTKENLAVRLPQLRDSVITLLSNKSFDEINTLEGKFQLRAEILSQLNQFLKSGKITNIYFTDFIIQ